MKRAKTIILMLAVISTIGIFLIKMIEEPYTTPVEIKNEFRNSYEHILKITEYLSGLSYSNINIHDTDYIYDDGLYGHMYAYNEYSTSSGGGKIPIENDAVIKELSFLFNKKKYQNVVKNKNTIYFQLWSNLDVGRGVVYTIDGSKPTLQFLTKLENLEKDNWYYYETDYNEWRINNRPQ